MNIAEKCDTIENENPNNRRNPLVANNVNVKKLEADLWESADLLRAGSKLTSNQYCMPVLGLIFLRYAYSRFKLVSDYNFTALIFLEVGVSNQNVKSSYRSVIAPVSRISFIAF